MLVDSYWPFGRSGSVPGSFGVDELELELELDVSGGRVDELLESGIEFMSRELLLDELLPGMLDDDDPGELDEDEPPGVLVSGIGVAPVWLVDDG